MDWEDFFTGMSFGIIIGLILFWIVEVGVGATYKHGQIDCINGHIEYELAIQPDSTTAWEMKYE
jgi:hypothetical protein